MLSGGYLAELETSAWLNDRRFRLLCFEDGSAAFLDLYFHTETNPRAEHKSAHKAHGLGQSFGITAEDATQQVFSRP